MTTGSLAGAGRSRSYVGRGVGRPHDDLGVAPLGARRPARHPRRLQPRRGSPLAPGGDDQAKLNAYTDGYNIVIGEFGLKQQLDDYQKAGINGAHPMPQAVYLTGGWLDQARAKLQAARAMPGGGLADVDTAADRFLPALQQVLTHEGSLNGYYQSKAWRDDGLARGKREDPLLVGEFRTAFATAARSTPP